ncbi:MAG TPA: ABC transporter ATP-binding protein [Candidatus Borkfalkia avicola]|uniref:ABC transporter ATP-binding protein n=1 Tax=Candidatus Borkfalkia avicola TaxID=2838503 RepID=A0A9D2D681_9FIRM|nr:ABC transporter ATP-binding protein [Candidatus Borkfalkia avicola]
MAKQKIIPDKNCLLEVHDVTMKFTKYDVGVDSLKELVVRAFRGDLRREKFVCLKNVSFKIHKGEAVAVIGRNGVGKSTLLKIVSGILKPTSGWARCNGRISPLLQLGAGFDGNATGIENIYLNAAIMGYTKKEIDAKMPDILSFAELGDFIYSPVKTYSSGMLARLGFSIAISMEAEIMLIDEILAVGDVAFQQKCYDRLAELREKGLTFLIVSHSDSVKTLCDRAIWIERGRVIADGPAEEIFDRYTDAMMNPEKQ